ncbi:MAG: PEGA domain-containing protein [Leptospirales bacterium]
MKKDVSVLDQLVAAMCALLIGLLTVLPVSVFHKGPGSLSAEPRVELYEQERRLVFLPLENDTRDPSLDYLSAGLIKILGGKVESIGYVRADRPARLLYVTPWGEAGAKTDRAADPQVETIEDPRIGRFSRAADGNPAPDELQRVVLNVVVRSLDEETYEVVRLADDHRKAAALKADYLVTGSYFYAAGSGVSREGGVTRRGPVTVRLKLFNAISGRRTVLEFESVIQTIYRELDAPSERIRDFVAGGGTAPVQVETAEAGAMVYLDNLYLGRTPIEGRALPGSYELRVEQEGYQEFRRRVVIDGDRNNSFRIRSPREDHRARLKVTTDPDGAEVYLNLERIGTTPLERDDLPPGTHRLRLAKAGHVDRYIGVELSNEDKVELKESLEPGDTETYFKDPNYVIFDWNHFDLGYYSFLGGLGFYGACVYFEVRANRIEDRIRSQLPFLSILSLPTLISQAGAPGLLYQFQQIDRTARQADRERQIANISAGLGIAMILAGAGFLIRGLTLDTAKETGEISWFFRDAVSGGDVSGGRGRSTFQKYGAAARELQGVNGQAELRAEPYYEAGFSLSF